MNPRRADAGQTRPSARRKPGDLDLHAAKSRYRPTHANFVEQPWQFSFPKGGAKNTGLDRVPGKLAVAYQPVPPAWAGYA